MSNAGTNPPRTTWFLRLAGSDSNTGLSPAQAFLSISHVASVAVTGDRVDVGTGYPDLASPTAYDALAAGVFLEQAMDITNVNV
jgi:hypothetical protein